MIKQAFEVYSLIGGGYNKRHLHGYGWTRADANAIADRCNSRTHIGVVHLIQINDRWHRVNVMPVEEVKGNPEYAVLSRIGDDNPPPKLTPAIFMQIDQKRPKRLGLNIDKAISFMAENPMNSTIRLSTLRMGGSLPITFTVWELHENETVQERVWNWLKTEINFRKENNEDQG